MPYSVHLTPLPQVIKEQFWGRTPGQVFIPGLNPFFCQQEESTCHCAPTLREVRLLVVHAAEHPGRRGQDRARRVAEVGPADAGCVGVPGHRDAARPGDRPVERPCGRGVLDEHRGVPLERLARVGLDLERGAVAPHIGALVEPAHLCRVLGAPCVAGAIPGLAHGCGRTVLRVDAIGLPVEIAVHLVRAVDLVQGAHPVAVDVLADPALVRGASRDGNAPVRVRTQMPERLPRDGQVARRDPRRTLRVVAPEAASDDRRADAAPDRVAGIGRAQVAIVADDGRVHAPGCRVAGVRGADALVVAGHRGV